MLILNSKLHAETGTSKPRHYPRLYKKKYSNIGVATWFICSDGLKVNENAGSVPALLPVSRIGKIYYFIIKAVKLKVRNDSTL